MPKEHVYSAVSNNKQRTFSNRSVEVAWGKDSMGVSVGACFPDDPFKFSTAKPGYDIDTEAYTSLHIELRNRSEVNKLIKVLRKARDQAFGADE